MIRCVSRPCAVFCLFAMMHAAAASAENWNQFRGPRGDGTSLAKELPTTWSETQHVKWKVPIRGKAWSSPVVWGEQIWLTTAPPDGKELFALCFDLATGKVLHDLKVFTLEKPQFCHERNSYASPTPYVEEDRVYVHFGSHGTACLDSQTGKTLWTRQDLECDHFRGAGSSPIVWEGLLLLTFDGFDKQYVTAVNKQTGETVWTTPRNFPYGTDNGDAKKAYATPCVVEIGGRPELITASAGATAAYDPKSGKELWRVKSGGMNAAGRPVVKNNVAFVGTADGGFNMFAVKLGGEGEVSSSHVLWKVTKGAPRYASPIFANGLLFMGNEQGVVTCVDAETGEQVWQKRLGGLFMPSPLYAAGKLYFFAEDGNCHVFAPEREFELVATNKLDCEFMVSPAVAGNALIVRSKTGLYRIEK